MFRFPIKTRTALAEWPGALSFRMRRDMKRINDSILLMKWNMPAVHDDVSHLFIQQTLLPRAEENQITSRGTWIKKCRNDESNSSNFLFKPNVVDQARHVWYLIFTSL